MNDDNRMGFSPDSDLCVVCGKNVQGNRGYARLRHEGRMVPLCCPLCIERFHDDPQRWVARRTEELASQVLKEVFGKRQ